jgi:hypothetical protein
MGWILGIIAPRPNAELDFQRVIFLPSAVEPLIVISGGG